MIIRKCLKHCFTFNNYLNQPTTMLPSNVKTSDNSPLYVNLITHDTLGQASRKIGLTFAPGKCINAIYSHVIWQRDVTKDLTVLKEKYQCKVLVSLIESFEFEEMKITSLREEAEKMGIISKWYPIVDTKIPESISDFNTLITELVDTYLKNEDTVIIHCKGGLGRTGTCAACILLHFGFGVKEAIAEVRKTRRGAIENTNQEKFIQTYEKYIQENAEKI